MKTAYDAIIVGARCAGSPTAMLLARKGYRVLVVDRATFPSDTVSSHVVHPLGAAALARWGLIDRLTATGCPPMHTRRHQHDPRVVGARLDRHHQRLCGSGPRDESADAGGLFVWAESRSHATVA